MRPFFITAIATVAFLGVTVQGQRQVFPGAATAPFSAATKADGLIYVAGTLATDGDIKVQTKKVLDDIGAVLAKAGSSLGNVAAAHVYVKNAADVAAMTEVWRTVFPKDPPTRTTIVADLVRPTALVEISMVAIPTGGERVVVTPAGWSTANPYSYAIKSGDTLFLSGMISRSTTDNTPIAGDMAAQTKTVMANAGELLKAAGFTFEDVVATKIAITDVTMFQAMNANYSPNFPKNPPARATVVAGLPGPQYLVEMTFTANKKPKEAFTTPAADGSPGKPSPILSSAIKVGNRLYVSGLLGNNADNKGNIEAQTKELMARVERTMKAAGYGWADVVDAVAYITDLNNFEGMNTGYRSVITKDFPARATVKVGLVGADGLVEIMFVASK
ncbi:MAG: RidA family protein [Vicinamibacterales bacterium]